MQGANKEFNMTPSLFCSCCGADVTAPQFYKGKVYGWTCIKKVNPQAKQVKTKWVKINNAKVVEASYQPAYAVMKGDKVVVIRGTYTGDTGREWDVTTSAMFGQWIKDEHENVFVAYKTLFPKKI